MCETNRVMLRNRRIGCSMSGIAQFEANQGLGQLQAWMDKGYAHIQTLDETIQIGWLFLVPSRQLLSNHQEQFHCWQVQHRESTSQNPATTFAV